jgi:signal peptidase I
MTDPPGGEPFGDPTAIGPDTDTEETPPTKPGDGHSMGRVVFEWVGLVVLALIIALLIKTFLFQAFYIPSESMTPTLKVHDRVLVNKLSYKLHPVHRDDIVVFTAPPHADPGINDLVKRVIGLPGETVSGKNGHVYINGVQLKEPYLPQGVTTSDFPPKKLPPDNYWVMGDNRGNSKDSRAFGTITKSKIVGRVFVRIWPLNRLGIL